MDRNKSLQTKFSVKSVALILALVFAFALPAWSAQPLSKDDISLLLIGGASEAKIVSLIEERGVDFQLTPELIQTFRKQGATQALIDAIVDSNRKKAASNTVPATESPSTSSSSVSGISPQLPGPGPQVTNISNPRPAPPPQPSAQTAQNVTQPAAHTVDAEETPTAKLTDPSPAEIQRIIQTFAAKEELFKEARDNYTYHQINKVETLDADGKVTGYWQQDWDILFDDNGKRIEKVTYAPVGSLKGVMITEQDIDAMRNIQPFVLTTEDLPNYEVKYLGHVKVDYITAYVFSVRPKEIKKHHQYFQGIVWVDDRDLQIVKAQGRQVPQLYHTKNGENLFPSFTTWRQQIDGKFWFPTYTLADDTLYFSSGPVHIREIIRYTDYKQFKSSVVIKAVQAIDPNNPSQTPNNSSPPSNPPPKK